MIFSAPGYVGVESDHFDGEIFYNQETNPEWNYLGLLKWNFDREPGVWKKETDTLYSEKPPERVTDSMLSVTFINHSTVLIQTDGLNILTDPVWSERVGPVSSLGIIRYNNPGIKFEDLPHIDLVFISHNHYDHLDIPTLKKLKKFHDPLFITSLGNKALLTIEGFEKVIELDWWQEKEINDKTKIVFVPARHFSMRGMYDRNQTLWGGFIIQSTLGPIYFAGDTGFGINFQQIYEVFGPVRFSMLPVGSFKPRWFMKNHHCSPEDAILAHKILKSKMSIPIHWGTFAQGDDGQYEAIDSMKVILEREKISEREVMILKPGNNVSIDDRDH